jgi:hypothetical protein
MFVVFLVVKALAGILMVCALDVLSVGTLGVREK